ncbi:C1q-related factor-like isoform X1 [Protopterus annectens]|uniref:C1q-related factor-like isoform X1 n=1 Tax=Protopterus annectens TaxID=7888 RepID=UPI001CFBD3F9|nr:C1q-related factor-like isoform X1 [Protopterus annectens]
MYRIRKDILTYLVLQLCLFWTLNKYCVAQPETTMTEQKGTFETCSSFGSINPRIAFHACIEGEKAISPKVISILFDNVLVNYGNGYNKQTGMFTCTIPGVYTFNYSLLPRRDSTNTVVWLIKNGDKLSYIHSVSTAGNAQAASLNAMLHLNAGDRVWIQLQQGEPWTGNNSLCFQGYQLFSD